MEGDGQRLVWILETSGDSTESGVLFREGVFLRNPHSLLSLSPLYLSSFPVVFLSGENVVLPWAIIWGCVV